MNLLDISRSELEAKTIVAAGDIVPGGTEVIVTYDGERTLQVYYSIPWGNLVGLVREVTPPEGIENSEQAQALAQEIIRPILGTRNPAT